MLWHVTIEAFTHDTWPGGEVTAQLRIAHKIRVERRGPTKDYVVATADIEAESREEAARQIYWRLRTLGVISDQAGGLLNAQVVDEHGQHHSLRWRRFCQSHDYTRAAALGPTRGTNRPADHP